MFQSHKYDYFESDSIYLETFEVIPMVGGKVSFMIPRIINGRIQVFASAVRGGFMNLVKTESIFIKKENHKFRIRRKKFKEQMRSVLSDDQSLLSPIDSEELTYKDIFEIIAEYNGKEQVQE